MVTFPRPAAAAREVEPLPWKPWSWGLMLVVAGIIGIVAGTVISLSGFFGGISQYEYHLWKWEANELPETIFAQLGLHHEPGPNEAQDALQNYFRLTSAIGAAQQSANPDAAKIARLEAERGKYTHDVDQIVESYIDSAISHSGLKRKLPLFTGVAMTWPPVAIDFTQPPQLLVKSPRDRIFREADTLLKPGLDAAQVQSIEGKTTNSDTVSLVIPLGGIAAYPAIVEGDGPYSALLELASHEWTHHYLAFWPLGQTWGSSADANTLNETTAEISGREIAKVIEKSHPGDFPPDEDGSPPPQPAPKVDFNTVMHDLRLKVDALLKDGKVDAAQQQMDATQKYLAANGIYVRKINQAYFAFYGTYATSPQSSNPIGPKVEKVWSLTQNIGLFLANMRGVTSVKALDATIARLEGAKGGAGS